VGAGFFVDRWSGEIENSRGGRACWLRMTEGGDYGRGEIMNGQVGQGGADERFWDKGSFRDGLKKTALGSYAQGYERENRYGRAVEMENESGPAD